MSAGNRHPEVLKPVQQDEPETEQCPFCTDTMQEFDGRIICLTCGWEEVEIIENIY
jgi:hypothetical protein